MTANNQSREALKPCPFCGQAEDLNIKGIRSDAYFWILCPACECESPPKKTEDEAITAWNNRHQLAIEGDVVEMVKEILRVGMNRLTPPDSRGMGRYHDTAIRIVDAMQPAIDKAVAEERVRCERLCSIYFDIAAGAIGEDEVRRLRDKAIEQGGGDA